MSRRIWPAASASCRPPIRSATRRIQERDRRQIDPADGTRPRSFATRSSSSSPGGSCRWPSRSRHRAGGEGGVLARLPALLLYVLMARARLMFALRVTIARFIRRWPRWCFATRARRRGSPPRGPTPARSARLVDAFRHEECHSRRPSLRRYLRAVTGRERTVRASGGRDGPLGAWYRFGSRRAGEPELPRSRLAAPLS